MQLDLHGDLTDKDSWNYEPQQSHSGPSFLAVKKTNCGGKGPPSAYCKCPWCRQGRA